MSERVFKDALGQKVGVGDWIATVARTGVYLMQITKMSKEGNLLCFRELRKHREVVIDARLQRPSRILNPSSSRLYIKVTVTEEWIKSLIHESQLQKTP